MSDNRLANEIENLKTQIEHLEAVIEAIKGPLALPSGNTIADVIAARLAKLDSDVERQKSLTVTTTMLLECRETLAVRERQYQHKLDLTNIAIGNIDTQVNKINGLVEQLQAELNDLRAIEANMLPDWLECYRDLATVPVDWRGGAFSVPKIERNRVGISFTVSRTEIN